VRLKTCTSRLKPAKRQQAPLLEYHQLKLAANSRESRLCSNTSSSAWHSKRPSQKRPVTRSWRIARRAIGSRKARINHENMWFDITEKPSTSMANAPASVSSRSPEPRVAMIEVAPAHTILAAEQGASHAPRRAMIDADDRFIDDFAASTPRHGRFLPDCR